jgi:hypothetical protein
MEKKNIIKKKKSETKKSSIEMKSDLETYQSKKKLCKYQIEYYT